MSAARQSGWARRMPCLLDGIRDRRKLPDPRQTPWHWSSIRRAGPALDNRIDPRVPMQATAAKVMPANKAGSHLAPVSARLKPRFALKLKKVTSTPQEADTWRSRWHPKCQVIGD